MPSSCCAIGCKERKYKGSILQFYRFPANPERRRLWVKATQRKGFVPTNGSRICSKHFVTGSASLDPAHPDYVPSIFSFTVEESEQSRTRGKGVKRQSKKERIDPDSDVSVDTAASHLIEGLNNNAYDPQYNPLEWDRTQPDESQCFMSSETEATDQPLKTDLSIVKEELDEQSLCCDMMTEATTATTLNTSNRAAVKTTTKTMATKTTTATAMTSRKQKHSELNTTGVSYLNKTKKQLFLGDYVDEEFEKNCKAKTLPLHKIRMKSSALGGDWTGFVHTRNLFSTLQHFREEGFLCDAKVVTDSKIFPVHRVVLAAFSPVFHNYYKSRPESQNDLLCMPGFDTRYIEMVIEFMYSGFLQAFRGFSPAKNMSQLIRLFDEFGVSLDDLDGVEISFSNGKTARLSARRRNTTLSNTSLPNTSLSSSHNVTVTEPECEMDQDVQHSDNETVSAGFPDREDLEEVKKELNDNDDVELDHSMTNDDDVPCVDETSTEYCPDVAKDGVGRERKSSRKNTRSSNTCATSELEVNKLISLLLPGAESESDENMNQSEEVDDSKLYSVESDNETLSADDQDMAELSEEESAKLNNHRKKISTILYKKSVENKRANSRKLGDSSGIQNQASTALQLPKDCSIGMVMLVVDPDDKLAAEAASSNTASVANNTSTAEDPFGTLQKLLTDYKPGESTEEQNQKEQTETNDDGFWQKNKNDEEARVIGPLSDDPYFRELSTSYTSSMRCDICGKRMLTRNMDEHRKTNHSELPFRCHCLWSFRTKYGLQWHQKFDCGKYVLDFTQQCDVCGEIFVNRPIPYAHVLEHKKYKCSECDAIFDLSTLLHRHCMEVHGCDRDKAYDIVKMAANYDPVPGALNRKIMQICRHCGKEMISPQSLAIHEAQHGGLNLFFCEKCGKSFATASELKMHSRIHDQRFKNHKHPCEVCGMVYSRNWILMKHRAEKHGAEVAEEGHKCVNCGRSFMSLITLARHQSMKACNKGEYKCRLCKYKVPTTASLERHYLKQHDKVFIWAEDGKSEDTTVDFVE